MMIIMTRRSKNNDNEKNSIDNNKQLQSRTLAALSAHPECMLGAIQTK